MTPRQRILNIIRRQEVDRLVTAPFIYLNFVRKFFNDPHVDVVEKTIEVYRHFGFDIIHRNPRPGYCHIPNSDKNWDVNICRMEESGGCYSEITEIQTPAGMLRQVTKSEDKGPFERNLAYFGNIVEPLIKSRSDFEIFQKYAPPQSRIDLAEVQRARRLVGEDGIIAPWVQGAFNFTNFFRSMEDLFSDPLLDSGFYKEMMMYFMDRNTEIIKQYILAGATVLSYGGNVANGRSVGPKYFVEFVKPYEEELIRRIHQMGGMIIYHNCGFAADLYDAYSEMGMDVFETLTETPFGDGDLNKAMQVFNRRTTLSGNIDQVNFMMSAGPQEVYDRTAELINKAKSYKYFIIAASDFLQADTPHENVHAFARAAIENAAL